MGYDPRCGPRAAATSSQQGVRVSMIVRIGIPLCAAVLLGGFPAAVQAQQASLSFFVTSVGKGSGADLGGIEGADAHCQALARAAGSTNANWRAYLSTTQPGGEGGGRGRGPLR